MPSKTMAFKGNTLNKQYLTMAIENVEPLKDVIPYSAKYAKENQQLGKECCSCSKIEQSHSGDFILQYLGGFPGTLLYETIIHYINTVPRNQQPYSFVLIKIIQNNFLCNAFTKQNYAQTFSIAECVKYLAVVTAEIKSFLG